MDTETLSASARLLVDGAEAFPEIIRCIREAKRTIEINMFIWRDDGIGNVIARELIAAADRGVLVSIVKDRYGVSCELSEEDRSSFFHSDATVKERLMAQALTLLYAREIFFTPVKSPDPLANVLRAHPNIHVSDRAYRCDHSKFYIFDDEVLILGGINIEDKENGADIRGRRYHDYMAEIREAGAVRVFKAKRADPALAGTPFVVNMKEPKRVFELEEHYHSLIRNAREDLTILMAYFTPEKRFSAELLAAARRGVRVRLVMPKAANYTEDCNKRTLTVLFRANEPNLTLYLTPRMLHAKLLMSEQTISFGSGNITKKAFRQLDELNLALPNDGGAFSRAVRQSVEATIAEAEPVTSAGQLRYHRIYSRLEGILM